MQSARSRSRPLPLFRLVGKRWASEFTQEFRCDMYDDRHVFIVIDPYAAVQVLRQATQEPVACKRQEVLDELACSLAPIKHIPTAYESSLAYSCSEPSCCKQFKSSAAMEAHYKCSHTHVCDQCHSVFRSAHVLGIHVTESHDSYFQAMAHRCDRDGRPRSIFECFVPSCAAKSTSSAQRRAHMVIAHDFPEDFREPHVATEGQQS